MPHAGNTPASLRSKDSPSGRPLDGESWCIVAPARRRAGADTAGESDADIIRRSWGDADAFEEIFNRHYRVIYRHVARRAGPDVAADVASEVFVRAFAARDRFKTEYASARPWLFGIATNLLRQHFRGSRRASAAIWRVVGRESTRTPDDTAASDARVDAEALGGKIQSGLDALRQGDRDVLLLYAWEDLSYKEIATALGIPIGTVRSRLARARRRFRELSGDMRAVEEREQRRDGKGDQERNSE
jgi:RNA polymerase sigma-70 factor (ECF subfamily)